MTRVDDGRHTVVLQSIGDAGIAHLPVLRQLRPGSDAHLAALMLQAPSALTVLPDRTSAEEVRDLLNASGLVTDVVPAEQTIPTGRGDYDVAVHVDDLDRMPAAIGEVSALLGLAPAAARDLLCAAPPALLGNVSSATVAELQRRFAAAGASLSVSDRATARYDVIVDDCPPRLRAHLLDGAGPPDATRDGQPGPVVLADLSRAEAERLMAELTRSSATATVMDRAFARYDVRLDAAPHTIEVRQVLVELTNMPEAVAHKVVEGAPIVLLQQVDRHDMESALTRLAAVGVTATGELTSLRRWQVHIMSAPDHAAVLRVIATVTGDAPERIRLPHTVPEPLGHLQARWLLHALAAAGATAEMSAP